MAMDITRSHHSHRWMFLQTRTAFEPREDGTYDFVEYAYLICICNGCDTVIKRRVKSSDEVDSESS